MPGNDWNGNGQSDAFDNYMDMILSSGVNETSGSIDDFSDFDDADQDLDTYRNIFTSKENFSGVDEEEQYSWREDYDYDFDHNIDPDDYETEEEYLEALDEAQIVSASVLPQSNPKISSPYKVGQTVLHDSFGIGNIIAVKPIGQEFLLDIDFQNIGIKQIFTRCAKLIINQIEIEKAKQRNKERTNTKDVQVYNFCTVFVEGFNDQYYYLFDDLELSVNDCVEVPFGKENTISKATVVSVGKCLGCVLPCDINDMKSVVRLLDKHSNSKVLTASSKKDSSNDNLVYEDNYIKISFVKWERKNYLAGGYARTGTFIFENKYDKRFCIYLKDISVGGFLNQAESWTVALSGKQKELKEMPFIYENKVPEVSKEYNTIEFKVCYGTIRDGMSSIPLINKPIIESGIISIKV